MRAIAVILVFSAALCGAPPDPPPLVDTAPAELARTLPYLAGLRTEPVPEFPDEILRAVITGLKTQPATGQTEDINEMQFEDSGILAAARREQARYSVRWTASGWRDARTDLPAGEPAGFFITSGFHESLNFLLPAALENTRFRFVGRVTEGAGTSLVFAFLRPTIVPGRQGLLWIDEETKRVLRIRQSLYGRIEGVPLERWSTDIRFTETGVLSSVIVDAATTAGREFLTVHRFGGIQTPEEPLEQMVRAVTLTQQKQAAAAIPILKDALGRDPQRHAIRFHLGAALMNSGDMAAAEAEWRAVSKALPNSAAPHNALGIALYRRGDSAAAAAEFQEAVRLRPDDPVARANLAKAQGASDTIRVDVRQVIVPVAVTASDGHFAAGLKQSDFQILEDGVEQKISSFGIESGGQHAEILQAESKPRQSATPQPAGPRRTYLICVDTLHSSLSTFNQVRQSLIKLFRSEQKGDSQYAVIAAGATMHVVQNMTTDPADAMRVLEDRGFQKLFQGSRTGSAAAEMEAFERNLNEVRVACDNRDPMCDQKRSALPNVAAGIAEADRLQTTNFLANLRSLVDQLGRAGGRRTMVLISAGFQISPGRDAYELLSAYFPELRGIQLRQMERMTDAMEPVFRLAAKNNVTIHTIDSRGLYTSSYQESSRRGSTSRVGPAVERALNRNAAEAGGTLDEIAATTGGTSFRNSNDMLAGISRAVADGRDYYVLSYVPSNTSTDGKFRAITVRVRDGKLAVRAKRGYWPGQ
ncbi:MAG: VWA domain-containing protein [Bryobacterales bacterium]|nr:VWA domain-containing protein [Bryobacterales bacterium]